VRKWGCEKVSLFEGGKRTKKIREEEEEKGQIRGDIEKENQKITEE